jgi:hypothetical protein
MDATADRDTSADDGNDLNVDDDDLELELDKE